MPEDRPTPEQYKDDEKFDNWLVALERKVFQRTAKMNKIEPQPPPDA